MSKIKSGIVGKLKIFLSIPFLLVLFWLFSCNKTGTNQAINQTKQSLVNSEKNVNVKDSIFTKVDKMPEFKGGFDNLVKFLIKNVKYPENAKNKGIEGKVFVSFTIDEIGKVTNPKIVKSVNPELDAEALRVISLLPDWIPGNNKGKIVKATLTLPINFKLN